MYFSYEFPPYMLYALHDVFDHAASMLSLSCHHILIFRSIHSFSTIPAPAAPASLSLKMNEKHSSFRALAPASATAWKAYPQIPIGPSFIL